jgi:hypothetical protein
MLLEIDAQTAEQLLVSPEVIREDTVIPIEFPEHPDSRYRAGYDWLFIYERRIAKFLEKWLRRYRYQLIGEKGILCEALSNAFSHGHNKDPELPIFVRIMKGEKGLLISIQDSGRGFNVKEVYNKYRTKKQYYSTAGNGLRLMAESPIFGIFHDFTGRAFNMLYLFAENLDSVSQTFIVIPDDRHTGRMTSSGDLP